MKPKNLLARGRLEERILAEGTEAVNTRKSNEAGDKVTTNGLN